MKSTTVKKVNKLTAEQIFEIEVGDCNKNFSAIYKEGYLKVLQYRTQESLYIDCDYKIGTIEFEAFQHGLRHGHHIATSYGCLHKHEFKNKRVS